MELAMLRTVLRNVVQVVPSNDDSTGHLGRDNTAGQNTTTNRDVTRERALLVFQDPDTFVSACLTSRYLLGRTNVSAVDRLSRRLEAKTNILVPPLVLGGDLLSACKIRLNMSLRMSCITNRRIPRALAFWNRCCFWYAFSI